MQQRHRSSASCDQKQIKPFSFRRASGIIDFYSKNYTKSLIP